jgi:hypothetical protein
MITRKVGWSLVVIALLLFLRACGVEVKGQDPVLGAATAGASSSSCTLATLQGPYAFFEQGTYVGKIGPFPQGPFPVAIVGSVNYDGAGNLTGTYTGNFGGFVVSAPFTGTYTVSTNCAYSDEFAPGPGLLLHTEGTISGGGLFQEIHYMDTDTGIVMSGTSKKAQERCSLETLKGSYALFGQGTVIGQLPGLPAPPFPVSRNGFASFDGAGNFSGELTASVKGVIVPGVTFTGTYTVESDCTTSAVITNSLGQVAHESGAISGNAAFREVHLIATDPGWFFNDAAKKQ